MASGAGLGFGRWASNLPSQAQAFTYGRYLDVIGEDVRQRRKAALELAQQETQTYLQALRARGRGQEPLLTPSGAVTDADLARPGAAPTDEIEATGDTLLAAQAADQAAAAGQPATAGGPGALGAPMALAGMRAMTVANRQPAQPEQEAAEEEDYSFLNKPIDQWSEEEGAKAEALQARVRREVELQQRRTPDIVGGVHDFGGQIRKLDQGLQTMKSTFERATQAYRKYLEAGPQQKASLLSDMNKTLGPWATDNPIDGYHALQLEIQNGRIQRAELQKELDAYQSQAREYGIPGQFETRASAQRYIDESRLPKGTGALRFRPRQPFLGSRGGGGGGGYSGKR